MAGSHVNQGGDKGGGHGLERNLENRHIQMIALGGAIGTGLFMGSGKTTSVAGPSILLVYLIIGVMLFFVMRALGELLLSNLAYKSLTDFADDLLGPWAGFFTGWTSWFCWIGTAIVGVVAIAAYARFFVPDLPCWIPALACVALLLGLNLVNLRAFYELEFWFAMIKIVAILAPIFVGNVMIVTGFTGPSGTKADLANITRDGLFPKGLGVFSTSRVLYGLAGKREAPASFGRLSSQAAPANGLYFTRLCLLGGVLLTYFVPDLGTAFTLITTLSAVLFTFVRAIILFSYIAHRKNRPEGHRASVYRMPGGVPMAYACLAFFAFVLVLLTFEADTRSALLVSPIWFAILGAVWMARRPHRTVSA